MSHSGSNPAGKQSGNSSVGRAQPCQGWGREFESRFPLQFLECCVCSRRPLVTTQSKAEWQNGYAADCKSVYLGSTPGSASKRCNAASGSTPDTFAEKQPDARVVKLVDTRDLKSLAGNSVPVQVRPRAPFSYSKTF